MTARRLPAGPIAVKANPASVEYDGTPRRLRHRLVDYEIPPAEMPALPIAYVSHAFGMSPDPPRPRAQTRLPAE